MATVGIIDIKMRTTTDEFVAGIAQAGAALRQFGNEAATFAAHLGSSGIGAAARVAGDSLVSLTKEAMVSVSVIGRASDRLGVTTEAFSGFAFGASKAGVEVGQLTTILEKMRAKLAEAATTGKGPASSALATLGLDAEKLANMDAVSSFKAIADALQGIENPAQKAQIAFKLFEEEGGKLLPVLAGGASGIEQMATRADELGITFSQMDFANVEAANQAWLEFGEALQGVGVKIAVGISPYLAAVAEKLTEVATQGGVIGDVIVSAFEGGASIVGIFADALYSVRSVILSVKGWFLELMVVISKIGAAATVVFDKLAGRDFKANLAANVAVIKDYQRQLKENEQAKDDGVMPSEHIKGFIDDAKQKKADIDAAAKRAEADKLAAKKLDGDAWNNADDLGDISKTSAWDDADDLGDIGMKKDRHDQLAGALEFGSADANKAVALSMGQKPSSDEPVKQEIAKGNAVAVQQLAATKDMTKTIGGLIGQAVATAIRI